MLRNKKINIALVGVRIMGMKHLEAIKKCHNVNVTAIIENNKKQIEKLDLKTNYYENISQAFKNHKIDGVIISTPNSEHLKNSLEVIEKNCPLLIEKPITTNSEDALKIKILSNKKNVDVLVGHHRRHNPIIKKAYDIINRSVIGEIRTVHINCQMYKPDEYFENAKWKKEKGAGPVFVNLIHDLDLMNYFCGDIESVHAQMHPAKRGYMNEDVCGALLRFKNGIIGTLLVSDSVASPWSWELTSKENDIYPSTEETCYFFGGSEGSLSLPSLKVWKHKNKPHWFNPMTEKKYLCKMSDPLVNQINHFCDIINKTAKPIIDPDVASKTIRVIEAIKESAKIQKTVFVN